MSCGTSMSSVKNRRKWRDLSKKKVSDAHNSLRDSSFAPSMIIMAKGLAASEPKESSGDRSERSARRGTGDPSSTPTCSKGLCSVKYLRTRANGTYTGNRLTMPAFDAMAPVMKGNTAAPAAPQQAIQPMAPEIRSGGITRPQWFMRIG